MSKHSMSQKAASRIQSEAVWALQSSTEKFAAYSETIIPALGVAARRKDNVAGYARAALAKWKSKSDANQGAK
jgi:hypothetical protein